MAQDSVRAKLDRAYEHILEVEAALTGNDPRARHLMIVSRRQPPARVALSRLGQEPLVSWTVLTL
jgi:hypothetical protein